MELLVVLAIVVPVIVLIVKPCDPLTSRTCRPSLFPVSAARKPGMTPPRQSFRAPLRILSISLYATVGCRRLASEVLVRRHTWILL
jgi:hypothetical protein